MQRLRGSADDLLEALGRLARGRGEHDGLTESVVCAADRRHEEGLPRASLTADDEQVAGGRGQEGVPLSLVELRRGALGMPAEIPFPCTRAGLGMSTGRTGPVQR